MPRYVASGARSEVPIASWIRRGFCTILESMTASVETWNSYAQLIARLSPRISHILFANADATSWWSSDPSRASRAQQSLSLLLNSSHDRRGAIDGLADSHDGAASCYGFRIRGALGELLGFVIVELPQPEAR